MIALNNIDIYSSWCGLKSYNEGLDLQDFHFEKIKSGKDLGQILGLEHSAVITLGKRGNWHQDLQPEFQQSSIEVVEIDRGGQATLHSPGQLVIYPVLNLRKLGMGVKCYVEILEATTIASLAELGIEGFRGSQAGVFTSQGKLAFIGVRVRHGISTHGISINFSNDLGLFQNIRSCGVSAAKFDRVANHAGSPKSIQEYFELWLKHFQWNQ